MKQKTASDFDPKLLNLFDRYVHGFITRREFLDSASRFAVGGLTAAAILDSLKATASGSTVALLVKMTEADLKLLEDKAKQMSAGPGPGTR